MSKKKIKLDVIKATLDALEVINDFKMNNENKIIAIKSWLEVQQQELLDG